MPSVFITVVGVFEVVVVVSVVVGILSVTTESKDSSYATIAFTFNFSNFSYASCILSFSLLAVKIFSTLSSSASLL